METQTNCPICKKWLELGNKFTFATPYPTSGSKVVYIIKDSESYITGSAVFKDGDTRTDALNYVNSKKGYKLGSVQCSLNRFKEEYGGTHNVVSVYLTKI